MTHTAPSTPTAANARRMSLRLRRTNGSGDVQSTAANTSRNSILPAKLGKHSRTKVKRDQVACIQARTPAARANVRRSVLGSLNNGMTVATPALTRNLKSPIIEIPVRMTPSGVAQAIISFTGGSESEQSSIQDLTNITSPINQLNPQQSSTRDLTNIASPMSGDVGVRVVPNSLNTPFPGQDDVAIPPSYLPKARRVRSARLRSARIPRSVRVSEPQSAPIVRGQNPIVNQRSKNMYAQSSHSLEPVPEDDPVARENFLARCERLEMRSRYWFFTSFAETQPTCDQATWCVFQQELTQSGRLHWQGVIAFSNVMRLSTVKTRLGDPRAHCEVVRNVFLAIAYVMKERTRAPGAQPVIIGTPPSERMKTHDELWWQTQTVYELWITAPSWMLENHASVRAFHEAREMVNDEQVRPSPQIHIYWGPTGTGKTRAALCHFPNERFYVKSLKNVWDGYERQDVVIFDEFDGKDYSRDMLQWLSNLPVRVPTTTGSTPLRASKFIFTMVRPWREHFPVEEHAAMQRRLTSVIECGRAT